ncbi:hypothetical protein Q0N48_03880 [Corynebacterium ureicelerivorans]|uniref:Uncharacterized protein n=1 Tax=Corynebacterium ureicelerivorans TaxID=401472 RepID=A0A077HLX7_9CORY|nr:hypothetical protein [Corynebacterium ureicelerivorans]AIL97334.1 hypothetical protein CUREI_08555 [Corynebacterium ureicelerivorans]MDN8605147.1 hypothetical protein [Corynebacterium ureicelerivorans]
MHYVSWDRTNRDALKLLAEDGPDILGVFEHDRAIVCGQHWELTSHPETGAVATSGGREIVRTSDSLKRAKRIDVLVEDTPYAFIPETSKNWVVEGPDGAKVAQFTQDHNGVRKAILEFEGETALPPTHVAGLAWLSRSVLEARKMVTSTALIATLVFLSLFTVVVAVL